MGKGQGPPERQLRPRWQLLGEGNVEQSSEVLKSTGRLMLLELKADNSNKTHVPRDECGILVRSTQDQFQEEHHHFFKSREM